MTDAERLLETNACPLIGRSWKFAPSGEGFAAVKIPDDLDVYVLWYRVSLDDDPSVWPTDESDVTFVWFGDGAAQIPMTLSYRAFSRMYDVSAAVWPPEGPTT